MGLSEGLHFKHEVGISLASMEGVGKKVVRQVACQAWGCCQGWFCGGVIDEAVRKVVLKPWGRCEGCYHKSVF